VVAALLLLSVILDGVLPTMGNTTALGPGAILNHTTTYNKADTTLVYELCLKDASNM